MLDNDGAYSEICPGDEAMVSWIVDNFPGVTDITNANGNLAIHFAAASGTVRCSCDPFTCDYLHYMGSSVSKYM